MTARLPLLGEDPEAPFPDVALARKRPEGLLAFGGDLSPPRLLNAYRKGIFPWFSEGQPLLWWSPDPRMVFRTDGVHLSSRLRRELRRSKWVARADTAFAEVIAHCAGVPRRGQDGTWITPAMQQAYVEMHRLGHAHSVEVFDSDAADARLVGGIYGIAVGEMFFGESMFSGEPGGSKIALAALARHLHAWGWPLIDAQVENAHLLSLGAERLPRASFTEAVEALTARPGRPGSWRAPFADMPVHVLAD